MKISNGTPKATALLEKLKNSGDSVDVYSDEFFNRQPTFQEAQGDAGGGRKKMKTSKNILYFTPTFSNFLRYVCSMKKEKN